MSASSEKRTLPASRPRTGLSRPGASPLPPLISKSIVSAFAAAISLLPWPHSAAGETTVSALKLCRPGYRLTTFNSLYYVFHIKTWTEGKSGDTVESIACNSIAGGDVA
jgi:hypothetical protein